MSAIARTDTSLVGRWWWTVDRWTLAALGAIVAIGAVLTLAASPPVAERLGLDTFHFAKRQFLFLGLAGAARAADAVIDAASADHPASAGTLRTALEGSGKVFLRTSGTSIVGTRAGGEE